MGRGSLRASSHGPGGKVAGYPSPPPYPLGTPGELARRLHFAKACSKVRSFMWNILGKDGTSETVVLFSRSECFQTAIRFSVF